MEMRADFLDRSLSLVLHFKNRYRRAVYIIVHLYKVMCENVERVR